MRLILSLSILIFSLGAGAADKGKVITDIDGTLRRTHVRAQGLEVFSLVWQAFVGNNYFSGMPELLHALSGSESGLCFGQESETGDLSYVTAAPVHIQFVGKRFLRKSCFPAGSYHAKPYLLGGSREHKFEAITTLIEESGSPNVLLIGDNGEHDVEVYDEVAQSVEGAHLDVFIHMVYSAPKGKELRPGQRPFLTGADLAAQLYELGWITKETFQTVVNIVHQDLFEEASSYERVFPRWVECSDFATSFRWPVLDLSPEMMTKIIEIDQAIGERCFRGEAVPIHTTFYEESGPLQCAEVLL